jgi:DNA-binding LytR/AlgR family response regulator
MSSVPALRLQLKTLAELPPARASAKPLTSRIAIKSKRKILFIDPHDIVAVQAEGNYVTLHNCVESYQLRESISVVAEKLKAYGFVRIHRSVLVNAFLVEEIWPWRTGEYGLRVSGGKRYRVTRTYKKNLRLLAELWIGMENFAE